MLLATLADEPGGGDGVKWQQGTFDTTRYGEMFVNGKMVRSGPSSSGDSFWDQAATPSEERSIVTVAKDRTVPAPQFKSVQDAIAKQYVPEPENKSVLEEIVSSVQSVIAPVSDAGKARTDYVSAQPSYYNLDSIFKSFGLSPQAKAAPVQVAKAAPQKQQQRATSKPASSSSIPQIATRAATMFSPLEFPKAQPARYTPAQRRSDPMTPLWIMLGIGAVLMTTGVVLLNRK
jgi:hypothetical protein